jgi:single-strand DNA-binding protein
MAQDITSFVVIGRITRDAEALYTQGGTPYCRFSVASNYGKKVNNQWEEEVSFFDFTLWGKRAESLLQYLVKGQQVAVSGQLRQDRWDQQGEKRSRVSFFVDNIQLLQRPGGSSNSSQGGNDYGQKGYQHGNQYGNQSKPKARPQAQPQEYGGPEDFEDDIPF